MRKRLGQGNIRMAGKHEKMLNINGYREMQIKTTSAATAHSPAWPKPNLWKCPGRVRLGRSMHCQWECGLVQALQRTVGQFLLKLNRDFLGDAVDKTPCSQCRGPGFDP